MIDMRLPGIAIRPNSGRRNPKFDWAPYLKILVEVFAQCELKLDALPKERMEKAVRERVLKDDSVASQLDLTFAGAGRRRTIKIKLEVDTNPPPAPARRAVQQLVARATGKKLARPADETNAKPRVASAASDAHC